LGYHTHLDAQEAPEGVLSAGIGRKVSRFATLLRSIVNSGVDRLGLPASVASAA
jgi:hypothetical protein